MLGSGFSQNWFSVGLTTTTTTTTTGKGGLGGGWE